MNLALMLDFQGKASLDLTYGKRKKVKFWRE